MPSCSIPTTWIRRNNSSIIVVCTRQSLLSLPISHDEMFTNKRRSSKEDPIQDRSIFREITDPAAVVYNAIQERQSDVALTANNIRLMLSTVYCFKYVLYNWLVNFAKMHSLYCCLQMSQKNDWTIRNDNKCFKMFYVCNFLFFCELFSIIFNWIICNLSMVLSANILNEWVAIQISAFSGFRWKLAFRYLTGVLFA